MQLGRTKIRNYDNDDTAHCGMLTDFLVDVHPPVSRLGTMSGAQLLNNNLIFGADYVLKTWNRCRELKNAGVLANLLEEGL